MMKASRGNNRYGRMRHGVIRFISVCCHFIHELEKTFNFHNIRMIYEESGENYTCFRVFLETKPRLFDLRRRRVRLFVLPPCSIASYICTGVVK